jgi:acyl-coenzyme A synthetase/AMP-(fatty) acid ligase/pimeloyl-ACP methyl ester carboxylesterase
VVAHDSARRPPADLDGLDPAWSRLVFVPGTDGVGRMWHLLDNQVPDAALTLLCVHGNPSWSYLFRSIVRQAPPGVRVIAVDQLDMGFSERSGRQRRVGDRIDELSDLTDVLCLAGPVVTVGHDWGGAVSLGWALRHRDRLAGVVLSNTAVSGTDGPAVIRLVRSGWLLRTATVRSTAFVRGALAMSHPRLTARVRRGFLAPYRSASRRAAIEDFVIDIPIEADHPSAAVMRDIAQGLSRLRDVPVLLLWGSADPVFSDEYLHDLERRLPHAAVHRYARAGHLLPEDVDAAAVVVDWIGDLGRLDGPSADAGLPSDSPSCQPMVTSSLADAHGALGERPAIVEMRPGGPRTVSFGRFADLVERTAAGLVHAGVRPGDRVALMIPPGVDLAVTLYACWQAAAVVVLIDSGLGPSGMSAAIRAAAPAYLVGIPKALVAARALRWPGRRISTVGVPGSGRLLDVVGDLPTLRRARNVLPTAPESDADAAVVFTSGATGPSKGVRYTHGALQAQRDVLAALYSVTPDDRLVAAFAPFALYGPAAGIPSVVPDMDVARPRTLTATALGDAAVAVGATLVFASPAALTNVVATRGALTEQHRAAFARVRLLLSAGAPVRPSLLAAAAELFPNAVAHTPYGMTECLPVATISLAEIKQAGGGDGVCVGRPAPGVTVRIRRLDERGRPTGELLDYPDVLGEVVIRAAHARAGYDRLWHTEYLTSQPAGWHATGDVGRLDRAGRLWIGGRLGHVVTTPHGPVAPVGLEQAVEDLAGVTAAAVVGVGPVGAQQLVVLLAPDDPPARPRPATLDLLDRVRTVAGGRDVVAVFELPRLPVDRRHNSKIDRTRLAGWAEQALRGRRMRTP